MKPQTVMDPFFGPDGKTEIWAVWLRGDYAVVPYAWQTRPKIHEAGWGILHFPSGGLVDVSLFNAVLGRDVASLGAVPAKLAIAVAMVMHAHDIVGSKWLSDEQMLDLQNAVLECADRIREAEHAKATEVMR